MISCQHITKSYNTVKALRDINISCKKGEISGLVGANGAGKTTLFKILLGLVTPDNGTVEIKADGPKKIGGIIEKPGLYPYLSAKENLRVFAKMQYSDASKQAIEASLEQVGLPLNRKDPVRNFSMGMKQRLGIAIALLNNPSCLLLDEPFSGLDPLGIEALKKLLFDLAKEHKMTLLISSHIINVLSEVCTNLSIIKKGTIVKTGITSEILASCTTGYTICGRNINKASFLSEYQTITNGNCTKVMATGTQISEIIAKLSLLNIGITSCTPELDLEQLFNRETP